MLCLDDYSGFLFDFDGLLVDSERIHYRAYIELLARRGLELPWSFEEYLVVAHAGQYSLRDGVYALHRDLEGKEPDWEKLRAEKREIYLEMIEESPIPLMPGAADLVTSIVKRGAPVCVVTHSEQVEVEKIRRRYPQLGQIPRWITREEYTGAKPKPDGYLYAATELGIDLERAVGFEDSPRGVVALQQAGVGTPIWVAPNSYGGARDFLQPHTLHVESLEGIFDLGEKEAVCGRGCGSEPSIA